MENALQVTARRSVNENSRNFGHFPDPPIVLFSLSFDSELVHGSIVNQPADKRRSPRTVITADETSV